MCCFLHCHSIMLICGDLAEVGNAYLNNHLFYGFSAFLIFAANHRHIHNELVLIGYKSIVIRSWYIISACNIT